LTLVKADTCGSRWNGRATAPDAACPRSIAEFARELVAVRRLGDPSPAGEQDARARVPVALSHRRLIARSATGAAVVS
jgi:hypothetical protein